MGNFCKDLELKVFLGQCLSEPVGDVTLIGEQLVEQSLALSAKARWQATPVIANGKQDGVGNGNPVALAFEHIGQDCHRELHRGAEVPRIADRSVASETQPRKWQHL